MTTILIGGLLTGCIYGITGLGYSLIYKASGLMNLSQGEFLMLGAYIGYTFYVLVGFPFIVSLLLTVIIMFFLGYFINSQIISKLLKKNNNLTNVILCTLAISMILQNVVRLIWGSNTKNFPSMFDVKSIPFLGALVAPEQIIVLVVSFICMLILHFFMKKTTAGVSMRAAALDSDAASVLGINVSKTKGITWGLSAALAGAIGCAVGPLMSVFSTMGALIGNKAFGGAVVGGYGNIYGTMIGGIIFGLVESFAAAYISTAFKDMISFGFLILVLIIKPNGIFNEKVLE